MDSQTRENCIATLKRLRGDFQNRLDARVILELDAVIEALEVDDQIFDAVREEDLVSRALTVIGSVLRLVTNITDFMN